MPIYVQIITNIGVIRSTCAQLSFVLGQQKFIFECYYSLRVDGTFMASQSILFEKEMLFI